jgi:glycine/D-amino acid oxidase-like deaminating enzyme
MNTTAYWQTSASLPHFDALNNDLEVDVVVVGGGLTGITSAYLLKQAGAKVALLERYRCAGTDTGHTTAHLTYVTDYRLSQLVKTFGKDGAQAFWEAGIAAINQIYDLVRKRVDEAEFRWVRGYLHARLNETDEKDRESLEEDAALARELGFDCTFLKNVPYANRPGVRFGNQAKFHPLKYLAPLLQAIPGDGSYVFENTEATEFEEKPLTIHAGRHKIRCGYVMIATHTPLLGKTGLMKGTLFQSKLALYTSYVLGAKLPRDEVPEALYWDTSEPYFYLRVDQHGSHDYAVFGGLDCKTGQE